MGSWLKESIKATRRCRWQQGDDALKLGKCHESIQQIDWLGKGLMDDVRERVVAHCHVEAVESFNTRRRRRRGQVERWVEEGRGSAGDKSVAVGARDGGEFAGRACLCALVLEPNADGLLREVEAGGEVLAHLLAWPGVVPEDLLHGLDVCLCDERALFHFVFVVVE